MKATFITLSGLAVIISVALLVLSIVYAAKPSRHIRRFAKG